LVGRAFLSSNRAATMKTAPTESSPLVATPLSAPAADEPARASYAALLRRVGPALLGNMIEFYEFGVYALVTEEITSNFFDATDKSGVWFGFAISFVARPFGGFFFGWMADAISRRAALTASVFGMIVGTVGIGFLPTQRCCGQSWGLFGTAMLMLFKILQGLCVGGELTTVIVFCAEHAGPKMAAFGVAVACATAAFGTIVAELVLLLLNAVLDDQQMLNWGWRVPFLIVLPWGIAAILMRRGLHEPDGGGGGGEKGAEPPDHRKLVAELWRDHKRHLVLGTLLFGGQHVGFWGNVIFPKSFLIDAGLRSSRVALGVALCGLVGTTLAKPLAGLMVDRLGAPAAARNPALRTHLLGAAQHGAARVAPTIVVTALVCCWPLWAMMVYPDAWFLSLVAGTAFGLIDGVFGVALLLIGLGLFPKAVRATGLGLTYNVAHAMFSATTPFVANFFWERWKSDAEPGTLLDRHPWLANTAPSVWPLITLSISLCALMPLLSHARGAPPPGASTSANKV